LATPEGLQSRGKGGVSIRAGGPLTFPRERRHEDKPGSVSTPVDGRDVQDVWLELQQELTLLSANSEIKMLEESGHYIQFDQPKVVVEAIQTAVQQCLPIQER